MDQKIRNEIRALRESAAVAYVGSVNEADFPQIKAMLVFEDADKRSMKTHYFSTNYSSKRVKQFLANPKACVYYVDDTKDKYKGALFTGTIEVCTDHDTKAMLWRDGCELYYPKGVDDDDYCVYKFTAETVNYYHGLSNITVSIDEL
ncbi:MAG: pyridoxamine 5'-phosphate oxidase family protein [Oscillospiraceae bacterium]|nr:pyridoxamine 5'-phosphate oxidase family protein [Oscillospiraceae bacterium]